MFLEVIFVTLFPKSFSQIAKFLVLKNLNFGLFACAFASGPQLRNFYDIFNFLKISGREFHDSLASGLRLKLNL